MAFDCSICLGSFSRTERFMAGHYSDGVAYIFHPDCIRAWLNVRHNCPACRGPIGALEEIPNPKYSRLCHGAQKGWQWLSSHKKIAAVLVLLPTIYFAPNTVKHVITEALAGLEPATLTIMSGMVLPAASNVSYYLNLRWAQIPKTLVIVGSVTATTCVNLNGIEESPIQALSMLGVSGICALAGTIYWCAHSSLQPNDDDYCGEALTVSSLSAAARAGYSFARYFLPVDAGIASRFAAYVAAPIGMLMMATVPLVLVSALPNREEEAEIEPAAA